MKVKSIYLAAIAILLFCIFSFFNSFIRTESRLQDTFLQSRGKIDQRIVIVGIDDQSLQSLKKWPWPRTYMADIINRLSVGKPAVIGIDVMFSDRSQNPEEDKALVKSVADAGNVVIAVKGVFDKYADADGKIKVLNLEEPFSELNEAAATGHINNMIDSDNIVRKSLYSFAYQGRELFGFDTVIYREYLKNSGKRDVNANIPVDGLNRWYISFAGEPFDFEYQPFDSVLKGDIPPEYFKDKIVLIGPYTLGMQDSYLTPLDHQQQMHGVEIHANIIQNLLYGRYKQNVSPYINVLIIILPGIAGYFLFRKLSPAKSAVVAAVFVALYLIFAKYAFNKGYILPLLYPGAIIITIYLIMLAYRYIEEYLERKRITGVFGRYVAPQIVDQILKGGEESLKLGGTRREITALFVDIRGFTPMSEKVQPEEVVEILNNYLNLTASSIFEFSGTLDKFIGDATMAIFNAPLDLEDHAFKAVQTAWAMKQGSLALQQKLQEKFGRSVQFGIGVNTGYAVVGNIGAKFRMDYTAIGDAVNIAARLESNAKPGQILLSQSTYELIKERIQVTSLGEIMVKGREQGVPVYQLDGLA